jgi:acetyl esterase/lipase
VLSTTHPLKTIRILLASRYPSLGSSIQMLIPTSESCISLSLQFKLRMMTRRYKPFLLSLEQNKDAPLLSKDDLTTCASKQCVHNTCDLLMGCSFLQLEWYAAPPANPEMSPLLYPSHKGLPPTYFQVCGMDPLRDEGLLYEKMLKKDGVETKLDM